MTDNELDRARAEREIKPLQRFGTGETTAQHDGRHAAYQRVADAWNDLVSARRAYDDGQGPDDSIAILEVALDRYRAAARACRRPR